MAKFNEILVGRFNRALQKYFGIKGAAPVPQLGSEIMPVLPFNWGMDNRYLESWQSFANFIQQAAVAAQVGFAMLRNPVGSNVVAVVEKVVSGNASAGNQGFRIDGPGPHTTDLATIVTSTTRFDARGQQSSTCILSATNAAGQGVAGLSTWLIAQLVTGGNEDVILYESQEIPLLPGDAITFGTTTVNSLFECSIRWRERFLEDSERF